MRPRPAPTVLALLGLVALALPAAWAVPASASCAAPRLDVVGGAAVSPGGEVEVAGTGFQDGCADSGTTDAFGCSHMDEEVTPSRDVGLRLEQDGRSWALGSADADESYETAWRVTLPDDLEPGRARLVADGSEVLQVRVVAPAR